MKTLDSLIDRCKLNLELMIQLQVPDLTMRVNEDDMKSFIYYLGELKTLHERSDQ